MEEQQRMRVLQCFLLGKVQARPFGDSRWSPGNQMTLWVFGDIYLDTEIVISDFQMMMKVGMYCLVLVCLCTRALLSLRKPGTVCFDRMTRLSPFKRRSTRPDLLIVSPY